MGIRQKIRLGFFALGLLLFFSGLMSYFELNKLSNSTRNMLDASLKNMELSKEMLDAVQDQNTALLQIMVTGSAEYDSLLFAGRAKFDAAIREAKISIRDLRGLDSIYAANVQYTGVINNFFDNRAKTGRSDMNWFVGVYKTSYYDLTASIKNFMVSSQSVMDAKTAQLESNAYRAIMPGIIALAIAIIIIVMFSYFIDLYYVRPVLKITEGLHNYLNSKIPFKITMEGRDEVHKLKEYIEAEIRHNNLEEYISQVLIPTEKVYTIRNGKKVSKEKVSYPGYVLVEAAFVGQIPIIIRNTPNVLGFLGDTKEDSRKMNATPLRPQEVARILGRVDEMNAMEEENEIPFFVGETVKVTDGPFSSFQGTIEAVDNERKKLTVSVKIFGRKTPMELGFTQVEKE